MEENTKPKEVFSAVSSSYENVKRYYDAKCKTYTIRVFKAEAQAMDEYCSARGCSVQALILAAIADYMAQGKAPAQVKRGRKKTKDTTTITTPAKGEKGQGEK